MQCSPPTSTHVRYSPPCSPEPSRDVLDDCEFSPFRFQSLTTLFRSHSTDKDATAALGKVWGKLRKKNGSSSKSDQVAAALAIEREGKIGGAEDEERIEDVIHEHDDEHLEDGHHYSPHLPDLRGRTSNPSSHHTLSREDLLPPHPHQPTDRERSVTSSDRRSEDSSVVATPEDSDVELAKRGVRNGKQKELESNSRQAML